MIVFYTVEVAISGIYSIASRWISTKWEIPLWPAVLGYTGIYFLLVSAMEIWETAKLYWDVLGRLYFDKVTFFI